MQTRKASLFEVCCHVGSGFIISILTWELLVEPLIEVKETFLCNFLITCIYTVVSITRCYLWRRLFNERMG